jgi:hypothetical protein
VTWNPYRARARGEKHLSLKEMLKHCLIVSLVLIQGKFFYIFVYWNWESVDCLCKEILVNLSYNSRCRAMEGVFDRG